MEREMSAGEPARLTPHPYTSTMQVTHSASESEPTTPINVPEMQSSQPTATVTPAQQPSQQSSSQMQLPQLKKKPSKFGSYLLIFIFIILPICGCIGVFMFLSGLGSAGSTENRTPTYSYVYGDKESKNELLSIKVDSVILTEGQSGGLSNLLNGGYVYGYSIKEELYKAAEEDKIKGVILEINSPGGTVTGSQAIADGIEYYRQRTKKPVYAYVQDLAASGGYWTAATADKIIADSGSLTGSIGVIFGPFEYYDRVVALGSVATDGGITVNYITGGTYKDFGNPFRKITEEEATIMQKEINSEYDNFVNHVAKYRGISPLRIRREIKSLVYGTKTAKEYGLIDEIGSREDSYDSLAKQANLLDYQIVRRSVSGGVLSTLFGSSYGQKTQSIVVKKCILCGHMLYLYGDPTEYQVVETKE